MTRKGGGDLAKPQEREPYVRQLFDQIARVYDPMNRVLTLGLWGHWQRILIRIVAPAPGSHFLDVATGTADLALLLADAMGGSGEVTGVDLSPEMLAVGRDKVRQRGLSERVHLLEGNALSLPFDDATFDGATVGFGLRNMSDLDRALGELGRVVRPGGRVFSLDVSRPEHALTAWGFHAYFYGLVPLLGMLGGKGREPYAWLPTSHRTFPGRQALEERFRQAGFVDVGSRPLSLGAVAIHWATAGTPR